MDDSKIMMSDDLSGHISDDFIIEQENRFIIANFIFEVDDRRESVIGSVTSRMMELDKTEICSRITTDDCFALSVTWPNLNLASYDLKLSNEVVHFEGPFQINSLGFKEIDHERRTCILSMKLTKV